MAPIESSQKQPKAAKRGHDRQAPRVKGGVNLDHFGGAKVDQLVKG